MKEQTIEKLQQMKLSGFITAYRSQSNLDYQEMSFDDRFALIVESEHLRRFNSRIARAYRDASLAVKASMNQVHFEHERGVKKKDLLQLSQCNWIENNKNIIFTGATGCGKTYISCALADAALKNQIKVKYFKTHELLTQIRIAEENQSLDRFLAQINKYKLIIFDEWLRDNFQLNESRFILDLIDHRFRTASCIFISQLPIEKWHSRLGEPTIADAILDRIIHDSFKLSLKGESMRKITATAIEYYAN